MSERNACVYCINEQGELPNGQSGPWCNYFNEPIKGYSRGAPDMYAGSDEYSHSGRAKDHQNNCSGFSLDPKMRERWNQQNFSGSTASKSSSTSSVSYSADYSDNGFFTLLFKFVLGGFLPFLFVMLFGGLLGASNDSVALAGLIGVPVSILGAVFWKWLRWGRISMPVSGIIMMFLAFS